MKKILKRLISRLGYRLERDFSKTDLLFRTQKRLSSTVNPLVVFDVGANVGDTALRYHQEFAGNCQIYAFEPYPPTFNTLVERTEKYPNIFPVAKALGEADGTAILNVNNFVDTSSLLVTAPEGIKNWGTGLLETKEELDVPVQTIDSFIEEKQIERIDILKMDTQGTEYQVLAGAKQALAAGKIKLVTTEIIVVPTYVGQKDLSEMLQLMKAYGFELHDLQKSLSPKGRLLFIDAIFIHNQLVEDHI